MSDRILSEAEQLIARAGSRGVTLRVLGSVAVWHHCVELRGLLARLERQEYRDIDLVGRSAERRKIAELFSDSGYRPESSLLASEEYGIARLIFHGPEPDRVKVDVFLDTLRMCHRIELADRLHLDAPTVSLADLLLSKLQIVRLTDNDIKDCAVLVAEHPFGEGNHEQFEVGRVVRRLADDWGFWYTATTNIARIRGVVRSNQTIPHEVGEVVEERLGGLVEAIERAPKSLRWRARQAVGTRVLWYEEVEDVER